MQETTTWQNRLHNMLPQSNYQNSCADALSRLEYLQQTRTQDYDQQSQHRSPTVITGEKGPQSLTASVYGLTTFRDISLGSAAGEPPQIISDVYFNLCTFQRVRLGNIKFVNCEFAGVIFEEVQFGAGVLFEGCHFNRNSDLQGDAFHGDGAALFKHCQFFGNYQRRSLRFLSCDLRWAIFHESHIENIIFQHCLLSYALLAETALRSVELRSSDLLGVSIYRPRGLDLYFSDMEHTLIDNDFFLDHTQSDGEQISTHVKSIRRLVRLLEYHNLGSLAGEYIFRAKVLEEKVLTGYPRVASLCLRLLCGYGERPSYTLGIILLHNIPFALLYLYNGISTPVGTIDYALNGMSLTTSTPWIDFLKCLFFSITTFTTVGYGNFLPLNTAGMVITGTQMMLGLFLCALWTGCILRKISR